MRTKKLGESVIGRSKATRSDGTMVIIERVLISAEDPTLTGSIWKAPPLRYEIERLAGGGEVTEIDDEILLVANTGERLSRC